jgi:hypothetical protein
VDLFSDSSIWKMLQRLLASFTVLPLAAALFWSMGTQTQSVCPRKELQRGTKAPRERRHLWPSMDGWRWRYSYLLNVPAAPSWGTSVFAIPNSQSMQASTAAVAAVVAVRSWD